MSGQTNVEYRVDIYDRRSIGIASRRFFARTERDALTRGSELVAAKDGAHGAVLVARTEEYVDSVESAA